MTAREVIGAECVKLWWFDIWNRQWNKMSEQSKTFATINYIPKRFLNTTQPLTETEKYIPKISAKFVKGIILKINVY